MQEQLGYFYDAAGNLNYRTNNTLLQAFNVNNLNELTTVTNGGRLTVAGTTTSPATSVTVNTSNAILYVDAAFASTNQQWTSGNNTYTAIAQDSYSRKDTNTSVSYLPTTNSFVYDLNGNMVTNGTRVLEYDDENQLIRITQPNTWKSEFSYDGKMRRRIRKEYTWNGSWLPTNEVHYIYDGNLVIQERDGNNLPQVTYTRGRDMSGTLQGAGGIGGLLARTANSSTLDPQSLTFAHAFYHADGNGNVTCLIYTNQTIAAKYKYDSYGNTLSKSGSLAEANLYRFSSEEYCPSASLICYLRRYYDPNLQRWLNRDPIAEQGGRNLYTYVANRPISRVDLFGFFDMTPEDPTISIMGDDTIKIAALTHGLWSPWIESKSAAGSVDWLKGEFLAWTGCKCEKVTVYEDFTSIYRHHSREVTEQDIIVMVLFDTEEKAYEKGMAMTAIVAELTEVPFIGVMHSLMALKDRQHYDFGISTSSSQYYQNEGSTFWKLTGARTEIEDFPVSQGSCHGWLGSGPKEPSFPFETYE
jgi:RHS repeat-associated protein